MLQNKLSVNWSYHKTRKKELMVMNILVKALRQIDPKESDGRISLKLPEPFWSLFGDSFKEMKVLQGVTCLEENQEEGLRRWNKGLKIIKLCTRHGFKSFRFLRSVKMRIWRLLKTSRRNQLSEFSSANQAWEPGGTVSLNTSVWLEIYHRHGGKWKSKLVRLYAEAKGLRRSRLERAYCVGKIQEASRVTKRSRTERGKAILIAAVENCLSYCEGAGSQNPNVDDNRVWNPGAVEVEGDKSCSSVIAEKLWNAEYRRLSVMDVQTNSENEVKWVVVLSVTRSLEGQKSFSSYEGVITVPAFGIWSLEDKAVILPGSTLKLYDENTAKLFLSAEKRIIEEAADCHEVNSQDLENVLITFIPASHYPSGVVQNLMRDSTQDSQAVLTQYHWSWYWILVVHNVLLCLHVSALCYHMFHLPRSPEFSLFEKVTGQELEEDNKTQDPVTLPPVSDAHDIDSNIQWHTTCGDVSQVPKLNSQGSLSKEGRVSYLYSNSGMSDALLNHKAVTPTSEKLQGREEMMEFYSYDWFQSPRPPELSKTRNLVSLLYTSALVRGLIEDHSNGALVITASKVRQLEDKLASVFHQVEDKLVLHRGSIDKHLDGPRLYLMGH